MNASVLFVSPGCFGMFDAVRKLAAAVRFFDVSPPNLWDASAVRKKRPAG